MSGGSNHVLLFFLFGIQRLFVFSCFMFFCIFVLGVGHYGSKPRIHRSFAVLYLFAFPLYPLRSLGSCCIFNVFSTLFVLRITHAQTHMSFHAFIFGWLGKRDTFFSKINWGKALFPPPHGMVSVPFGQQPSLLLTVAYPRSSSPCPLMNTFRPSFPRRCNDSCDEMWDGGEKE